MSRSKDDHMNEKLLGLVSESYPVERLSGVEGRLDMRVDCVPSHDTQRDLSGHKQINRRRRRHTYVVWS